MVPLVYRADKRRAATAVRKVSSLVARDHLLFISCDRVQPPPVWRRLECA